MDLLDRAEAKWKAIACRFAKKDRDEFDQVFSDIREELQKRKQAAVKKAVTEMVVQGVAPFFRLQRDLDRSPWIISETERRQAPGHLMQILTDAGGISSFNQACVRSRLDAILLTSLALKKREELDRLGPHESVKSVHFQFDKYIKLKDWTHNGKKYDVAGRMDYSLWYGFPEAMETNLVVVEDQYPAAGSGYYQALSYMAMIHPARKTAGRSNTIVHGVVTDGDQWEFLRINPQSGFSSRAYRWNQGEHVEIVSQLYKIFAIASELSPVMTRNSLGAPLDQSTSLSFREEEMEMD